MCMYVCIYIYIYMYTPICMYGSGPNRGQRFMYVFVVRLILSCLNPKH